MADRWWVDDNVDGDWNQANNWSATEGGAGGAGIPTASDDAWFSNTSSPNDCVLTADSTCADLSSDPVITGGTDRYTGKIDTSTFNLAKTGGDILLEGNSAGDKVTFTIGTSSGNGVETGGWFVDNDFVVIDFQVASVLRVFGNYIVPNVVIWATNTKGILHSFGTANYSSPSGNNRVEEWVIETGAVITCTDSVNLTTSNGELTHIKGSVSIVSNRTLTTGSSSTGAYIIEATGDVGGAGTFNINCLSTTTFTDNHPLAHSLTGTYRSAISSSNDRLVAMINMSNADYQAIGTPGSNANLIASSGTLKCVDFEINSGALVGVTIDWNSSTNDPNFEVSGDIDFHGGSGAYTLTYTKGTGTFKLTGSGQAIDLDGKDIETIFSDINIGSVTCIAGDTWNIGTLDLTTTNLQVDGVLEIGATASNGLTCSGTLDVSSSGSLDLQTTSVINANDDVTLATTSLTTVSTGILNIQSDLMFTSPSASSAFAAVNVATGVTLTFPTGLNYITSETSGGDSVIDGIIDLASAGSFPIMGCSASGSITFNVGSDIIGAGALIFLISSFGSFTNNAGAKALTGTIIGSTLVGAGGLLPILNTPNANLTIQNFFGVDTVIVSASGTASSENLAVVNDASGQITVTNSTNNPNFNVSATIDLNSGTGTYTTVWNRGTGLVTLSGNGGLVDLNGQTFEKITGKSLGTRTVLAADTWDISDTDFMSFSNLVVSGTMLLPAGDRIFCQTIVGTGTLTKSTGAGDAIVYYTGNNLFTGTVGAGVQLVKLSSSGTIPGSDSTDIRIKIPLGHIE